MDKSGKSYTTYITLYNFSEIIGINTFNAIQKKYPAIFENDKINEIIKIKIFRNDLEQVTPREVVYEVHIIKKYKNENFIKDIKNVFINILNALESQIEFVDSFTLIKL